VPRIFVPMIEWLGTNMIDLILKVKAKWNILFDSYFWSCHPEPSRMHG